MSDGSSIAQRLSSWIPRDLIATFEAEVAYGNQRRFRSLLPLFTLGHLLHVWAFYTPRAQREELDRVVVTWRDGIAATHLITAVIIGAAAYLAWRPMGSRGARILGPLVSVIYLWHAATCLSIDQLTLTSVSP